MGFLTAALLRRSEPGALAPGKSNLLVLRQLQAPEVPEEIPLLLQPLCVV